MSWRMLMWSMAAFLAIGAVAAIAIWQTSAQSSIIPPPELPEEIEDRAVRMALESAREGVLKNPRSAEAWGELGWVFRAHELNAQAASCFEHAAQYDSSDPRWPYLTGTTNIALGREAIPQLRDAYRLSLTGEAKSLTRLRLAEALFDSGAYEESRQLFQEELAVKRSEPRAQLGLGQIALMTQDPSQAVGYLELAAESPLTHAKATTELAAAHRRMGRLDLAARCEREAATCRNDQPYPDAFAAEFLKRRVGQRMLSQRANELEAQRRYGEAVEVLEDLARDYPSDQSLVHLGQGLLLAGDVDRAERTLRSVVQTNPAHAAAHFFLGRTLTMRAKQALAAGESGQCRQLEEDAAGEFRKTIACKQNHGPAFVDLARVLQRLEQYREAIEAAREAVRINPQAAEAHLALGEVLLGSGKRVEAIASLEEANRLCSPTDKRAKALLEAARGTAQAPQ